ncbi:hypothetical protein JW756_01995 [Candidatus Woesearchaeota archaeon]|nr:hypothetical protein [Candidatus Woesearchaeota archaeon]
MDIKKPDDEELKELNALRRDAEKYRNIKLYTKTFLAAFGYLFGAFALAYSISSAPKDISSHVKHAQQRRIQSEISQGIDARVIGDIICFHGGTKLMSVKDFDIDGIKDMYFTCRDGVTYAKLSSKQPTDSLEARFYRLSESKK